MPNMSYCRFQNTLSDLKDCLDWLHENDFNNLSQEEKEAAESMYEVCENLTVVLAKNLIYWSEI